MEITQWGFGKDGYELYELKKDPGEFTNQANNPEYAAALKQLRGQLEEKRRQAGYQGKVTQEHADRRKAQKARRTKMKQTK